jgi:hypothetical protein
VVQVDWDEAQQVVLGGHQLIAGKGTQGATSAAAQGKGGGGEGWRDGGGGGGGVSCRDNQGDLRVPWHTMAHKDRRREEVVLGGHQLIAGKGTQGGGACSSRRSVGRGAGGGGGDARKHKGSKGCNGTQWHTKTGGKRLYLEVTSSLLADAPRGWRLQQRGARVEGWRGGGVEGSCKDTQGALSTQ